jgi:hypothetical protein
MALNINGVELDFDFTSPEDLSRYRSAIERMQSIDTKTHGGDALDDDEAFAAYVKTLKEMLGNFSAFLDEAFGEGTAVRLLGDKPSLQKIMYIQDAINREAEAQSRALAAHYAKYTPNRADRRSAQ